MADNAILVIPTLAVFTLLNAVGNSLLGILGVLIMQALYIIGMLSSAKGQTLGNRVASSRVVRATDGGRVTTQQVCVRWAIVAAYSIPAAFSTSSNFSLGISIFALVDCLYPLFNERKQTWHDRIAGTVVVRR